MTAEETSRGGARNPTGQFFDGRPLSSREDAADAPTRFRQGSGVGMCARGVRQRRLENAWSCTNNSSRPQFAENDMDTKSLFEILIRENTDMLVAYIRAGVRDEHAVDDIYQETVLTAWKRLNDYQRDKPIGPWLRGIAGKLMLAFYRKTSRTVLPLDEQSLEWLNDRFAAIHSMSGDTLHEKLAALRECIAALPDTYQRPINMRYAEQRSLSEIESLLNLAKEALKKRLSRGKARLTECLEGKLGVEVTP